jgi:hypothetical protein
MVPALHGILWGLLAYGAVKASHVESFAYAREAKNLDFNWTWRNRFPIWYLSALGGGLPEALDEGESQNILGTSTIPENIQVCVGMELAFRLIGLYLSPYTFTVPTKLVKMRSNSVSP